MYHSEQESDVSLATIALAKYVHFILSIFIVVISMLKLHYRYRLSKYLQPTPILDAHEFGKRAFFKLEIWNKVCDKYGHFLF